MSHKETGELKKRAWLAKQRLKMGYWESVRGEGGAAVHAPIADMRYDGIGGEVGSRDEKLYSRVCDILDRDETVSNPIGQLIDNDVYSQLDSAGRQRYILELSNKFRELKERYYREKAAKSGG